MSAESEKLDLIRSDPRAWVEHQASPYVCSDPVATAHVTRLLAELDQATGDACGTCLAIAREARSKRAASLATIEQVRARIALAENWSQYSQPDLDGWFVDANNVEALLVDLTRILGGDS
ncbi:hypothetical protein SEA_BOSNIA_61 [Gordonia phage Bosnia]|uniref:Uncharacterized protein n=1 Tax=Gordonia phage Bosnia TaxID=2776839 RepID=A0A7L8ZE14_9CAUD|nr:hypothetical protein PP486_gp61 [Gordonia phage Bosnia]QOI66891.1 hypothetical protein SEA_BOSNIA_61 [Gordonia phage Bosnia]